MRSLSLLLSICLMSTLVKADPDELMEAVKSANTAKIEEILKTDPRSVNTLNAEGEAPMHWAAISGQLTTIELLIRNDADVNIRSTDDWTPLHWAILKNHVTAAELLIRNKADVNAQTKGGWTPLHVAAYKEYDNALQLLIASGADPELKDQKGKTPLQTLAEKTMITMEILINGGAKPPEEETPAWSPLGWISRRSERAREKSELKQKTTELEIKTKAVEELQQQLETELEAARKERSEAIKKLQEKYQAAEAEHERKTELLAAKLEEAENRHQILQDKSRDPLARQETDRQSIAKLNEQLQVEMDARLQLERTLASATAKYKEQIAKLAEQTWVNGEPETKQQDSQSENEKMLLAKEKIADLQSKLDEAIKQTETLKAEKIETTPDVDAQKELEEANEMKRTLLLTFEQQKQELEAAQTQISRKNAEVNDLKEKFSKLQWAAMNTEASSRSASSDLKRITDERNAMQSSLADMQESLSAKAKIEEELKSAYEKLNSALNTISNQQTKLNKVNTKINELENERDMARNMLTSMETRIGNMPDKSEFEKLAKVVTELEEKLRESGNNMERLRKQLVIASKERSELELRLKKMAAGRQ